MPCRYWGRFVRNARIEMGLVWVVGSSQGFEEGEGTEDAYGEAVGQVGPDDAEEIQDVDETYDRVAEDGKDVPAFGGLGNELPEIFHVLGGGDGVHANGDAEPVEKPCERVGDFQFPGREEGGATENHAEEGVG